MVSALFLQNDPLPGRITARVGFTDKELPFGEKDTKSKVTLLEGDHVQFNISTDRRDKLERATNIDIFPDTFNFTKESREMVGPAGRRLFEPHYGEPVKLWYVSGFRG